MGTAEAMAVYTSPPVARSAAANSMLPFAAMKFTLSAAARALAPRSQTQTVSAPLAEASTVTALPAAPSSRMRMRVGKTVQTPFSTIAGAFTVLPSQLTATLAALRLPLRTMSASLSSGKLVSLPMETAIR